MIMPTCIIARHMHHVMLGLGMDLVMVIVALGLVAMHGCRFCYQEMPKPMKHNNSVFDHFMCCHLACIGFFGAPCVGPNFSLFGQGMCFVLFFLSLHAPMASPHVDMHTCMFPRPCSKFQCICHERSSLQQPITLIMHSLTSTPFPLLACLLTISNVCAIQSHFHPFPTTCMPCSNLQGMCHAI